MTTIRESIRRALDQRLTGLDERMGPHPPHGWIRAIRDAREMSTYELSRKMGVSQPRVAQLERAEVTGTIQLRNLMRAAEALDCSLCYVLVPREPLEQTARPPV